MYLASNLPHMSCVVISPSAVTGVAISAQAMARRMEGSPIVCVCTNALLSDPPSVRGGSEVECLNFWLIGYD